MLSCYLWCQIGTASLANPGHSHIRPVPHTAPGFVRMVDRIQLRQKTRGRTSREDVLNQS